MDIQLYKGRWFSDLSEDNYIDSKLTPELFKEISMLDSDPDKLDYDKLSKLSYSTKSDTGIVLVAAIKKDTGFDYMWVDYEDFKNAR